MAMRSTKTKGGRRVRAHARPARGGASKNGNGAIASQAAWEGQRATWDAKIVKAKERPDLYPFTLSGIPIKPLYGPEDIAGMEDVKTKLQEMVYNRGMRQDLINSNFLIICTAFKNTLPHCIEVLNTF